MKDSKIFIFYYLFYFLILYNLVGDFMINNLSDKNVSLRRLCDNNDDYKLLQKWYQKEYVYLYFEQRMLSFDEIKEKYYNRTLENSDIPVYIIEYDNKPIGIIQYKLLKDNDKKMYNIDLDSVYELDIFIGESDYHNLGIGKITIDLMCNYLFDNLNAKAIVMCPMENNYRAIRCYEKCIFKKVKTFIMNDTIGNMTNYVLMMRVQDNN